MPVSLLAQLEELKSLIRCTLISVGSKDVTIQRLNALYREETDRDIPYKDHNFTSLLDFLKSINDVCRLKKNIKNEICVYHKDTDKTKHVSDLVSKTPIKQKKQREQAKFRALRNGLFVCPHTLLAIFNKLSKQSPYSKRHIISKHEVLSEIETGCESMSFFDMDNLNNQLDYYSHILRYDDDKIYFRVDKLENFRNGSEDSKLINDISNMIKSSTLNNLQKLTEKYTEGIVCSELPTLYCREYKLDLEYSKLGFNSIVEFIYALPDILKLQYCHETKKTLIIHPKQSKKDSNDSKRSTSSVTSSKPDEPVTDAVPKVVSSNVSKTLIPNNFISCDEIVQQTSVTSLLNKNIDVIVADVYYPSFFWVTLAENKQKMSDFEEKMNNFYNMQNLNSYKVPPIVLQPGLNVACIYNEVWYRGVVTKFSGKRVKVLLYDYGTVNFCKPEKLYFLDRKFSTFPIQAIACSLYDVQPLDKIKWDKESSKMFADKVLNNYFSAFVTSVDEETNSMVITLIDVNKFNLVVSKWLIAKNSAIQGQFFCEKHYEILKHNQRCLNNPIELREEWFRREHDDRRNHEVSCNEEGLSTQSSLSRSEKLKCIRKLKEQRLSSSSQGSPNSSITTDNQSNPTIENIQEEHEDFSDNLSKTSDETGTLESARSDIDTSESSSEQSDYKMTEHESSYAEISSVTSSLSPPIAASNLDSDDTEYVSISNETSENLFTTCESSPNLFTTCESSFKQFVESNKGRSEHRRKYAVKESEPEIIHLRELRKLMNSTNYH